MPGLLVSVRNAAEATAALTGGADLIDVKEPGRGALGAADAEVWPEVLAAVAGRVPTSAALGEVRDGLPKVAGTVLPRFGFVKIGLAGIGGLAEWRARWRAALSQLPAGPTAVAVVYADWLAAAAPPPQEVVDEAFCCGCGAVLVDTGVKDGSTLLHCAAAIRLPRLAETIRRRGLTLVLAGALDEASVPHVLPLQPDYIAVRCAVCRGTRMGTVDAELVRSLKQRLVA